MPNTIGLRNKRESISITLPLLPLTRTESPPSPLKVPLFAAGISSSRNMFCWRRWPRSCSLILLDARMNVLWRDSTARRTCNYTFFPYFKFMQDINNVSLFLAALSAVTNYAIARTKRIRAGFELS